MKEASIAAIPPTLPINMFIKNITTREASELLCKRDYELKKSAYEKIYGKKLDYKFENSDIAGWRYEK